jgi:hypothetical protein
MSGGEAAVGVAGLALAVPGVIDLIIKYGLWIHDVLKNFENARGIWKELRDLGWELAQGELNDYIISARSFLLDEGCSPGLKNSLRLQIDKLASHIIETRLFLESQEVEKLVKRGIFAISGYGRAKELNQALSLDKRNLIGTLVLGDIRARRVPDQLLLDGQRFVQYANSTLQPVPSTNNLFSIRGDYRENPLDGEWGPATVMVERSDLAEAGLKQIASFLYNRLPEKLTAGGSASQTQIHVLFLKGILPCLGYRMTPFPQLLFAMPTGLGNPQMLDTLIRADQGVANHPLDYRFQLARKLADAVLRVNAAELVHKHIRTAAILVLQPVAPVTTNTPAAPAPAPAPTQAQPPTGLGEVYLTDWRLLRDTRGPTTQTGGTQWTENIYRHPQRQDLEPEARYNIGHDIYSLGVCLLEIGLWDMLVHIRPDGQPEVSPLFRDAADVNGLPDPVGALATKLTQPTTIKGILVKMANEYLPQRLGFQYTRLVVACLTGLDQPVSGFGEHVDFKTMDRKDQAIAFKDLMLSYFTSPSN